MKRTELDAQLNCLLDEARDCVSGGNLDEIPYRTSGIEWYRYEMDLWQKGEEIRQLLKRDKVQLSESQIERILEICSDQRGRKGRQSFVLLLGKKHCAPYAAQVLRLLNDQDVNGQVIDTLYKMGVSDYVEQIKEFLGHEKTWIRNCAKKYVDRYGK